MASTGASKMSEDKADSFLAEWEEEFSRKLTI
jgi:hypothetical protein